MKIDDKEFRDIIDKTYREGYKDGVKDGKLSVYDEIINNLANIRDTLYARTYGHASSVEDAFDKADEEEGG